MRHEAIYKLYPEVVSITGKPSSLTATAEEYETKDIDGVSVVLDDALIDAEIIKMQEDMQLKMLAQKQEQEDNVHRQFLADTDWYIIRNTESGWPIPEEILEQRATARSSIL